MPAEYYKAMVKPNGELSSQMACHALFFYSMLIDKSVIPMDNAIVVEGVPDPVTNARNLFKSVGKMYNVEPEAMTNYWIEVNSQRRKIGLDRIPDKYQLGNPLITSTSIVTPSTGIIQ